MAINMLFVWLVLYGGIYTITENLSQKIGFSHLVTAPAMLLYLVGLVFWLYRTERADAMGLRTVPLTELKKHLFFLPLGAAPLYSIFTESDRDLCFSSVVLMLSVSVAEELLFRGYLLHSLSKWSKPGSILISGGAFAFIHIVNLYNGAAWPDVLLQMLFAFAVGISFAAVTLGSGSLIPCIAAHFFINISSGSKFSGQPAYWLGLFACMAVYIGYGAWIFVKNIRGKGNQL